MKASIWSLNAQPLGAWDGPWPELLQRIADAGPFPEKKKCPLIKLATFGDKKNASGALRHDGNILGLHGIVADYDGEKVSIDEAIDLCESHGIRAAFYPTYRAAPGKPRWRIMAPLASPTSPRQHEMLLNRLNGALGGILAGESWTLSQTYFFGSVEGIPYGVRSTFDDPEDGTCIDQLEHLEAIAIGKPNQVRGGSHGSFTFAADNLRTGDGRREILKSLIGCLSNEGKRPGDVLKEVEAFVAEHFDTTDTVDWKDIKGIIRYIAKKDAAIKPAELSGSVFDIFEDLAASQSDVEGITDAEWVVPGLIPRGHIVAFPAPSGGGKTALMSHFAGKMAQGGYSVLYIDVDSPPDGLKVRQSYAQANGFKVIAPDLKVGKSIDDVRSRLTMLAESPAIDVSRAVFIIDTLKKFADMLDKTSVKAFYLLLRRIATRGATFVLLSHTNKYKDENGFSVFEGTADSRADVDDMIYLDHERHDERMMIEITTRPDKVRAIFPRRSFRVFYGEGLRVEECEEVINLLSEDSRMIVAELEIILAAGSLSQKDVVSHLLEHTPFGRDKLRSILFSLAKNDRAKIGVIRGAKNSLLFHLLP